MFEKRLLLNISGHPLSAEAEQQLKDHEERFNVVDINVPNVDVNSVQSIMEYIKDIAQTLCKNSKIFQKIRRNDYLVIPPGLSILTSGTIALLHGISGTFPQQVWLVRNDEGKFMFGEDIDTKLDLQDVRIQFRDFRQA